ncbi:MAG: 16S rRNA (cytosine(1402)-N(4))-methyltransferase RsmH [Candidatus Saccharibacteria bacterium]|nr:16S rRNA (cytosine(1402)-N(4))-methyltransferase RsmH [Candidatus Saccharibacteria bacterium]
MHQNKHQNKHTPVLLEEVLQYLDPRSGDSFLDLTAGYGGHAAAMLERTLAPSRATLVDRDQYAVEFLQKQFGDQVKIVHQDFLTASQELRRQDKNYECILADLGTSSPHLDNNERGFSIQQEGPLDMRMDQRQSLRASTIVNEYSMEELERILKDYGEEPKAKKIAELIIRHRPIHTTSQLAEIVKSAWRGRSRIHPATRTFQALRIAVNSELEQLEQAIPLWVDMLAPGGRLAIISFHSLEDRIVKQQLAKYAGNRYDADLRLLSKKPVIAGKNEKVSNPRARSAKLRVAAKINNKQKGEI